MIQGFKSCKSFTRLPLITPITAALDATDGNIRKVQKLSRHADPRTLMIYDDNRNQDQQELSGLLSDMV